MWLFVLQVSVIKAKLHEALGMPAGKQKLQYDVSNKVTCLCSVLMVSRFCKWSSLEFHSEHFMSGIVWKCVIRLFKDELSVSHTMIFFGGVSGRPFKCMGDRKVTDISVVKWEILMDGDAAQIN